ncbi:hypothetical protein Tco_1547703 [Tanacetum coccineum]
MKKPKTNLMKLKLLEDLSLTSSVKKEKKSISNKKGKYRDVKKMIPDQIFAKSNSPPDEPAKVLARVTPEQE